MSVFDIRTDLEKNRLHFILDGFVRPCEARRVAESVVREAQRLAPGFQVIQDTSAAWGANTMEALLADLQDLGMGRLWQVVECDIEVTDDFEAVLLERLLGT